MPYQQAPDPPVSSALRRACEQAMHVVTSDGRVLRAGRAALFVLRRTTFGWRVLSPLLALPPFVWAVELGYQLIARNRRLVSRLFLSKR